MIPLVAVVLAVVRMPSGCHGKDAQVATQLSDLPNTYEQISYIVEESCYYLENFNGDQFGEMRASTNGMFIIKAIKQ